MGKVRLALTPWLNHSWHVPLYVNARGLTTSPIYYEERALEIVFDFNRHVLEIVTSEGWESQLPLKPRSVAAFFEVVMAELGRAGIKVEIDEHPSEIPNAIPFSRDTVHAAYDRDFAHRFWQALLQADRVLKRFRTGFIGKCSPVHFFWGSFDLAVTRFSGRRAPEHPGGVPGLSDEVVREAYSHEVSSAGFWPGGGGIEYPAFYSYAYPEPEGFQNVRDRTGLRVFQPGTARVRVAVRCGQKRFRSRRGASSVPAVDVRSRRQQRKLGPGRSRAPARETRYLPRWRLRIAACNALPSLERAMRIEPVFVFDLDGTLVDSVYHHVFAWREALEAEGISLSFWRIHRKVGMSGGLLANQLLRETGVEISAAAVERVKQRHAAAYKARAGTIRPLPGAIELLSWLSDRKIPWAIATSGHRETAEPALAALGVDINKAHRRDGRSGQICQARSRPVHRSRGTAWRGG